MKKYVLLVLFLVVAVSLQAQTNAGLLAGNTRNGVVQFFLDIWLLLISAAAGAVGYYLYAGWNTISLRKKLCGFSIIVLVLHVLEEWVYPSGLYYIHNVWLQSPEPTRYPMNQFSDMITNFFALVIAIFVFWKWNDKAVTALTLVLFCFLEVASHTQLGFLAVSKFSSAGMSVPYSPGLATSLFGFLPIGIGFIVSLKKEKDFTIAKTFWALLILIFLIVMLILIPEIGMKDLNTPYNFPNNGYYDRYIEQSK
ncbi:HXXEE domain-containing protein [Sphingobacterium multivorum]|uniref:HXXEE domain-containing protein n=1 Tax=Sphingobacterium multivorum TaxID=28454 RepID=UPI00289FF0DE|nr:HXXEE domain-containing protein [Sphingobacterium multivorum]